MIYQKANVVQFRLIIRDSISMEIIHIFSCLDTINFIQVNIIQFMKIESYLINFELIKK
jgi:hypothetical protein